MLDGEAPPRPNGRPRLRRQGLTGRVWPPFEDRNRRRALPTRCGNAFLSSFSRDQSGSTIYLGPHRRGESVIKGGGPGPGKNIAARTGLRLRRGDARSGHGKRASQRRAWGALPDVGGPASALAGGGRGVRGAGA